MGTAAGATGVALAAAAWKPAQAAAAVPDAGRGVQSAINRTFRAGVFQLNLDGANAGILKSEDGGDAYAEVVAVYPSEGFFAEKHISNFKYDDFTLQVGLGMNKAVYEWISASWKGNQLRPDGSIVTADFNFQAKSEREFVDGLITEIGIPACDGSSKDAGYLTLTFSPESTRDKPASGPVSTGASKQKAWTTSNFRLELAPLDTKSIAKIDAFTVKQSIITENLGESRIPVREPGRLEFPNLKITIGQASLPTWAAWFDDFVIKGNNSVDYEKSGRIVFLAPDLKVELAEIRLFGVGIYRLDPDPEDPSSADKIARFTAELYVERMEFNCPPQPVGGA